MKKILFLLLCCPALSFAQQGGGSPAGPSGTGVNFREPDNWGQLLDQAKKEGKLLFVDLEGAESELSQQMDKEVFSNPTVGRNINRKFISIRLSFVLSPEGSVNKENLKKIASDLKQRYKTGEALTYLFFSPEGKLLHKAGGFKGVNAFIREAANAANPSRQYYTLLEKYRDGPKQYLAMPYLANAALKVNDTYWAKKIADDFINNYLMKLPKEELFTYHNIEFISGFVHSGEKAFNLFYRDSARVDELLGKGTSRGVVDFVITNEDVDPKLWKDLNPATPVCSNPDWQKLTQNITDKYGRSFAERVIADAKPRWYASQKNWPEYCNAIVERVEKYGPFGLVNDRNWQFNSNAWDIFLYSTEKPVLLKALEWSGYVIGQEPQNAGYLDTYANLLYKLSRITEAIAFEQKAVALDPSATDIRDCLEKMKRREPTWPVE